MLVGLSRVRGANAVLKITYKIFSRLIYNKLRVVMDEQQPHDQTGFRAPILA